ncbi:MAG: T9SS type A sorting domain-containing protein, partial [Candidatus Cloacimonas sp.]
NYGVLIVDETADFSGSSPFQPTDEQVDSFYDQLISGLWNASHFDLATLNDTLRLCDLGIYSVIIWHGNDFSDMFYPYYIKDALKKYIYYGGKVLFSLYHPSKAFEMNDGYPASFAENTFSNEVLGISNANYTFAARFNEAHSVNPDFIDIEVDPNKVPTAFNGHLYNIEVINPTSSATPLYSYASAYDNATSQGILNGGGVGILHNYYAGKAITLSFPFYNMDFNQSRQVLRYIIETCFEEPVAVTDEILSPVAEISILPNQPNPFVASTQINILCKNDNAPLEVKIYNLKGQLVKTLYKGIADAKNTLTWNGTDQNEKQTASGIYLIKANQGNKIETRKILKLK